MFAWMPASSFFRGCISSSLAVLLTIVLELSCLSHVRKLLDMKGGPELYRSALWTNVRNNLMLGPLTYYLTIEYVCSCKGNESVYASQISVTDRIVAVAWILISEGALYYYIHKCFHEVKSLYWMHR